MKTTKSIIVVLFVLLTAQIASAYYCPSTGRWLSRDPISERGFQTLQTAAQMPVSISSRWINRDPRQEVGFNSVVGSPVNKQKSNSEIANDYFAKLFLERPYVRQKLEPLVNRINWDTVKILRNESKQENDNNVYAFVNNTPISYCDYLGLNLYGPNPLDVSPCIIIWHGMMVGLLPGITPASANCPLSKAKNCCEGANNIFNAAYSPGGIDSINYSVALGAAGFWYNFCLNRP